MECRLSSQRGAIRTLYIIRPERCGIDNSLTDLSLRTLVGRPVFQGRLRGATRYLNVSLKSMYCESE